MMFSMASVTMGANVAVKKYTFAQLWLLALSPPVGGEISDPKSLLHYVYCLLVYRLQCVQVRVQILILHHVYR